MKDIKHNTLIFHSIMKGIEQNRWRDTCYSEAFRLGEIELDKGEGVAELEGQRAGQIVDGEDQVMERGEITYLRRDRAGEGGGGEAMGYNKLFCYVGH